MTRPVVNEGAPEAPALPELPAECTAFMKLMGDLDQVQRIEGESASALPALRAEAARAGEEAEKVEGDALLGRISAEVAEKASRTAAAAREAVQVAGRRASAAGRERQRLEAEIIRGREAAGLALRGWGQDVARQHAEAYQRALRELYGALGDLAAIRAATGGHVIGDARVFRLPPHPTATDRPACEVVAARLPALDGAGDVRMALEQAERLSWRSSDAAA